MPLTKQGEQAHLEHHCSQPCFSSGSSHLRSSSAVGGTSLLSAPIRKMAGQPRDRLTSGWCRQRSASSMWPLSVSPGGGEGGEEGWGGQVGIQRCRGGEVGTSA